MKEQAIKQWLGLVGSKPASTPNAASGWLEGHCPLAPWRHAKKVDKNPSFGVEVATGDSRVHCFSCGYSGRQSHVVAELFFYLAAVEDTGAIDLVGAQALIDEQPVGNILGEAYEETPDPIFPEWYLNTFKFVHEVPEAMAYLAKRHVGKQVAYELDLRWDAPRRRIMFPTVDSKGQLRGVQGRATRDQDKLSYLNYKWQGAGGRRTWLGENRVTFDDLLIVVEGPFDMARVYGTHPNVIAACGAGSVDAGRAKFLTLAPKVLSMLDGDTAGSQGREKLSKFVPGIIHATIPEGKDPGDMDDGEISEIIICAQGGDVVNLFGP